MPNISEVWTSAILVGMDTSPDEKLFSERKLYENHSPCT